MRSLHSSFGDTIESDINKNKVHISPQTRVGSQKLFGKPARQPIGGFFAFGVQSQPRSFTKLADRVTSSGDTPSCSTTMERNVTQRSLSPAP